MGVMGVLLYLAFWAALAFLIIHWAVVTAIRGVLQKEPELLGRVMLRLIRSKRFRDELKGVIAEAWREEGDSRAEGD